MAHTDLRNPKFEHVLAAKLVTNALKHFLSQDTSAVMQGKKRRDGGEEYSKYWLEDLS